METTDRRTPFSDAELDEFRALIESKRQRALDEIEADVRAAWTDERYREIRQRAADEMRARYTVVIPELDPADLSNLAAGRTTASADLVQ